MGDEGGRVGCSSAAPRTLESHAQEKMRTRPKYALNEPKQPPPREWAARFGHAAESERGPQPRAARISGASDPENRLLRILTCCFTETVGCFILRHVRKVVTDPELRSQNLRHLADEVQHSRVGRAHPRRTADPQAPRAARARRPARAADKKSLPARHSATARSFF